MVTSEIETAPSRTVNVLPVPSPSSTGFVTPLPGMMLSLSSLFVPVVSGAETVK
jgi:hypothetical protein